MLDSKADVHSTDEYGRNSMHIAAGLGILPALKLMMENGGDFLRKDKYGRCPLYLAKKNGRSDCLNYILEIEKTKMTHVIFVFASADNFATLQTVSEIRLTPWIKISPDQCFFFAKIGGFSAIFYGKKDSKNPIVRVGFEIFIQNRH